MNNNINLEELAKEKAEEIIYRQKIQELSVTVTEVMRVIPGALKDLRQAIELLENTANSTNEKISSQIEDRVYQKLLYVSENISNIQKGLNALDALSEKMERNFIDLKKEISDKNNPTSVIVQMEEMFKRNEVNITDLNNERSLLSQMKDYFNKVLADIKKGNNIRTLVTWAINTLIGVGTIVTILLTLAGGK